MAKRMIVAVDRRSVRWHVAPSGAARAAWSERIAIMIAVRDHTSHTGLGEAAPLPGMSTDTFDDAARAIDTFVECLPAALESPLDAAAIAQQVAAAPAAQFAIETALLVTLAQRERTSVANLLVATPRVSLTFATVVDDEDEARVAVARGARCLKVKAIDRVARIAAAAPGVHLRIDLNRAWPRGEVADRMAALRGLTIDYIEEPCVDAHELLGDRMPFRIALDESLVELRPADLSCALRSPHLAAIVLKPTLLGGFARCLELAAAARRHGVAPIVSHALEGPVGLAACVELARAIGGDAPVGLAPHPALVHFAEAA